MKKKVLLSSIIFTSLIVSNVFSDRLEDQYSWDADHESCIKTWENLSHAYPEDKDPIGPFMARGKDFEIDDIYV